MVLTPKVILYDEPTSGLDPATGCLVSQLIRDTAQADDITSVVVTHDVPSAFLIADRLVLLMNGKIVFDGAPSEVKHQTQQEVRDFFFAYGDEPMQSTT